MNNKMEKNREFYFDGGRDRVILPHTKTEKLIICPIEGTSFCGENCPIDYEKCDRLKELTKGDYAKRWNQ